MLVVFAAAVAGGCGRAAGKADWHTTGGPNNDKASGGTLTAQPPAGFSTSCRWMTTVEWRGADSSSGPTDPDPNLVMMALQATAGLATVVGGAVVAPQVAGGAVNGGQLNLQFLDAATGKVRTTKQVATGQFYGIRADTAAGKPVAVVRYESTAAADEAANDNQPLKVTAVYAEDGTVVWTSAGKPLQFLNGAGLVSDTDGFAIFSAGYVLRASVHDSVLDSYDIMDTTGAVAAHLPNTYAATIASGYVLASGANSRYTAYDLSRHAANVGAVPVSGGFGALIAASNGKLLIGSQGADGTSRELDVFDTRTGRATKSIKSPVDILTHVGGVADGDNLLLYDNDQTGLHMAPSFMVDLAKDAVAWTQQDNRGSLLPISLHNGKLYGLEVHRDGGSDSRTVAITEATGAIDAQGFTTAPVAYTSSGGNIFAEWSDADPVGLRLGLCGAA